MNHFLIRHINGRYFNGIVWVHPGEQPVGKEKLAWSKTQAVILDGPDLKEAVSNITRIEPDSGFVEIPLAR